MQQVEFDEMRAEAPSREQEPDNGNIIDRIILFKNNRG